MNEGLITITITQKNNCGRQELWVVPGSAIVLVIALILELFIGENLKKK